MMKRILFPFFIIVVFSSLVLSFFSIQETFAQNFHKKEEKKIKEDKKRQKFLIEMQNLLNAAKKSGYTEKEIREISVIRNNKVIYVWDFLEQEKLRVKKEKLAKKKSKPLERYLTVMDISNELESGEKKDLDVLKDKSIFVGAEQQ